MTAIATGLCTYLGYTTLAFLFAIATVFCFVGGFPSNKDLEFAQKYRKLDGPSADPAEVKKYREEHPGVGVTEAAYEVKRRARAQQKMRRVRKPVSFFVSSCRARRPRTRGS